jgi:GNAT superfamily N-acetyltransferase
MKLLTYDEIKVISKDRNADVENRGIIDTTAGMWYRFNNYEDNPPLGHFDNDKLVAVAFVSKLKRSNYINLYEIASFYTGRGYGTQLWKDMIKYYYEQGVARIKFKALYSAISFYKKLGIYFWGFDGKSFIVDQPLYPTIEETLKWRDEFVKSPFVYDNKVLIEKDPPKKLEEEIKRIKEDLGDLYYLNRKNNSINLDEW